MKITPHWFEARLFPGRALIGLLLLIFLIPSPAFGAERIIPRRVLAVYDSRVEKDIAQSELHTAVQTILEYLGLVVDYLDAAQGKWPNEEAMSRYRGVVTRLWGEELPRAESYLVWLRRQIESGRRVVVLGHPGPSIDARTGRSVPRPVRDAFFRALGVSYGAGWTTNPAVLEYGRLDRKLVRFERAFPARPPVWQRLRLIGPGGRAVVSVRRTDVPDGESPMVCLTAAGGLALDPYFLFRQPNSSFRQWYIDPFAFFEAALNLKGLPRPDAATLSGRRLLYCHIDGDGLTGFTELKGRSSCGEVIRDLILKVYDLPTTASVITAEVDPRALGDEKAVALARSIMALDNVEPGCHSFSHPFSWGLALGGESVEGLAEDALSYGHHLSIKGYRFNLDQEIEGAVTYINRVLAPPGKTCAVYQWTGDCRPPAEAIARVERMGLAQINGGDTVFDANRPSVTGVAPLVLPVGDELQVYTSNSNENIYTNLWTGPFWGFRRVVQTFVRTGSPRRLRPMNIYYHFYSGANLAALNALRYVYDWALKQPLTPIFTSHYYRVVRGVLGAKLADSGDGGFKITDYGAARTIRFDGTGQTVDLERSINVQGFTTYQDSLYVHLGPGEAVIYLTDAPPRRPYLVEASGLVEDWSVTAGRASFRYQGWGRGEVVIGGLKPSATVRVTRSGRPGQPISVTADSRGRVTLKDLGRETVVIEAESR